MDNDQEREANEFAMCLLMPEKMVREHWAQAVGKYSDPGAAIRHMAKLFQVEEFIMTIRLQALGLLNL